MVVDKKTCTYADLLIILNQQGIKVKSFTYENVKVGVFAFEERIVTCPNFNISDVINPDFVKNIYERLEIKDPLQWGSEGEWRELDIPL